jgi:hypothetical protein
MCSATLLLLLSVPLGPCVGHAEAGRVRVERARHEASARGPAHRVAGDLIPLSNAFGSLGLAVLALLNVPFASVGGAIGLRVIAMPVSIAVFVGFIALVGQASRNGVLVPSAIEARRKRGAPRDEAVLEGSRDRLRAVLMTAALPAFA